MGGRELTLLAFPSTLRSLPSFTFHPVHPHHPANCRSVQEDAEPQGSRDLLRLSGWGVGPRRIAGLPTPGASPVSPAPPRPQRAGQGQSGELQGWARVRPRGLASWVPPCRDPCIPFHPQPGAQIGARYLEGGWWLSRGKDAGDVYWRCHACVKGMHSAEWASWSCRLWGSAAQGPG